MRGGRYYDPLATFGALGAHTATIRFAAHVLVLGYHHPLEIAKRYGTLDVVTGGRVIVGVGVGSLQEEFELLGAPFDDRGARADDAMRALRAAALATAARPTTATSTISPASSSSRARYSRTSRCGSAAARTGRCAGRSSSATAGSRSVCAPSELAEMLERARGDRSVDRPRHARRHRSCRTSTRSTPLAEPERVREQLGALRRDRRDGRQRALRPPLPRALLRAARRPRRPSSNSSRSTSIAPITRTTLRVKTTLAPITLPTVGVGSGSRVVR